jgi:hypothetical protein
MFHKWLSVRLAAAGLALVSMPVPAQAADPFVLFLLRMIRDQAISRALEAGVSASRKPAAPDAPAAAKPVPQQPAEDRWLKGLIEESFVHLAPEQRDELYASMMRILADPRNAAQRAEILAEFTRQAVAVRDTHRQLSSLSDADMRRIAVEARTEFEKLPQDQRQQLLQGLRGGIPGMPRALHDRMLAEFSSVASSR